MLPGPGQSLCGAPRPTENPADSHPLGAFRTDDGSVSAIGAGCSTERDQTLQSPAAQAPPKSVERADTLSPEVLGRFPVPEAVEVDPPAWYRVPVPVSGFPVPESASQPLRFHGKAQDIPDCVCCKIALIFDASYRSAELLWLGTKSFTLSHFSGII